MPIILGKSKRIILKGNEVNNDWEVESPSGVKNLIVPNFTQERLEINHTDELGVYNVFKNKELYTSFATELHPNEVVTKQLTKEEIDLLLNDQE